MLTGIIITIIFIFLLCKPIFKNHLWLNNTHKLVGYLFPPLIIIHFIFVLKLYKQRPKSLFIIGIIIFILSLIMIATYILRKKLQSKFKPLHIGISVLILISIILHIFISSHSLKTYKNNVENLNLDNINLSQIKDGKYIGSCNVGYIYAKVSVVVQNNKIITINLIEHRTEKGKPAEKITNDVILNQTTKVDTVSGATNSSKVILKAIENALNKKEID